MDDYLSWLGPAPDDADAVEVDAPIVSDAAVLQAVTDLAWAQWLVSQRLDVVVGHARSRGVTWHDIGVAAGMTKQAAQRRWAEAARRPQPMSADLLGAQAVALPHGRAPFSPRGKITR